MKIKILLLIVGSFIAVVFLSKATPYLFSVPVLLLGITGSILGDPNFPNIGQYKSGCIGLAMFFYAAVTVFGLAFQYSFVIIHLSGVTASMAFLYYVRLVGNTPQNPVFEE
jgi:hypothetical protein